MEKFYIWGAGIRGTRLLCTLGKERIAAFVDANPNLRGQQIQGAPILSPEDFFALNPADYLIVSAYECTSILDTLQCHHFERYFLLSDCPYELQDNTDRLPEFELLAPSNKETPVALYGLCLYSVLFSEWLRNNGYTHFHFTAQADISASYVEAFQAKYGSVSPVSVGETVCLMVAESQSTLSQLLPQNSTVINAMRLSLRSKRYYLPELNIFHNLHKGERCFIVATGPSMTIEDLNTLHRNHVICLGMNQIFKIFNQTEWRPDYYFIADTVFLREFGAQVDQMPVADKFAIKGAAEFWKTYPNTNVHPFYEQLAPYTETGPYFSDTFSNGTYSGCSVTYTCLQFAVFAGFQEIYLLGCDHNYPSDTHADDRNHFIKDYDGKSKNLNYNKQKVELAYLSAKRYADAHGIKIYNATRGGKLEVFERADFDSLFTK